MKITDFFSLQTLATCGNLIAGFSALVLAVGGDFVRSALLVGVAVVFDTLDGFVARRSEDGASEFGANLDSLADIVSFGVAPAFALFFASLSELGSAGVAFAVLYVVAGALRLARFPLVRDGKFFVGLPIPPAGLAVALISVLDPSPALACLALIALGALMVSSIPFPSPKSLTGWLRSSEARRSRRERAD